MRTELRTSWPARLVALSFIVMILLANLWFVDRLTGQSAPVWMQQLFGVCLVGVGVGALGLLVISLKMAWQPRSDEQADTRKDREP